MYRKAFVLSIVGVFFFMKQAFAQYLSINGQFEVDQEYGCHDLTVTITNIDPGTDPSVVVFQFDGSSSPLTQNPVHTYTSPGTFWINQYIQGATGQKKDSVMVTVVAPELPDTELLTCNNNELLVQIYDTYYDVYEIDYGDGTIIQVNAGDVVPPYTYASSVSRNVTVTGLFTTATNRCGATATLFSPLATVAPAQIDSLVALSDNSLKLNYQLPPNSVNKLEVSVGNNSNYILFDNLDQNTTIDTLTNLNITQNNYCFRIATYDACSNFKSYSNEVCSVNLLSSAQNNQITLNWNTIDLGAGQTTNLSRDGNALASFAAPFTQHIDSTVVCLHEYCYQADILYPSGAVSRSLTACETAFSTDIPPEIENISSITGDETIDWTWEIPSGIVPESFQFFKVDSQGNVISSETTSSNSVSTTNSSLEVIHYASVEINDNCGNVSSKSSIAPNLVLLGSDDPNGEIQLTWNSYTGWLDGVDAYSVVIKDIQGNLVDSVNVGQSTTYSLSLEQQTEQTLLFTVWAIPIKASLSFTRSNMLTFEHPPIIAIPNSFTPNGDGINDNFIIQGKFISEFEMEIYDRWGEALFHTTEMEKGWDGNTSKGKRLPVGNYAYWIRIKDFNGNDHIRTGSVLILKN
ncbi:MAG: gliding motility-associated C-terminal domain-containing protein [Cyclobacteriaceae bacterium]|nr:gliding motility-associated C-terminal domain-containing protein [Cyclobacteriaceae bacterium]